MKILKVWIIINEKTRSLILIDSDSKINIIIRKIIEILKLKIIIRRTIVFNIIIK